MTLPCFFPALCPLSRRQKCHCLCLPFLPLVNLNARLFDESFAPIPKCNERFARQYRIEPPSVFPLTLPCSGIIHRQKQQVSNSFNHSLYHVKIRLSSYPEGNFRGNQLLDSSMSLSPLYPSVTNDLHVSIALSLHQSFP